MSDIPDKSAPDRSGYIQRREILRNGLALLSTTVLAGCGGDTAAPAPTPTPTPVPTAANRFVLQQRNGAISSLTYQGDTHATNYIRQQAGGDEAGLLGQAFAYWRTDGRDWSMLETTFGTVIGSDSEIGATAQEGILSLASSITRQGAELVWRITARNTGGTRVEIGDFLVPLPMNTNFFNGQRQDATVLKHSFVSGHGSHVFWMRSNSEGPYLLLLPEEGTHLEYWQKRRASGNVPDAWCVFFHAAVSEGAARAEGTNWRQPVSSLFLDAGQERQYGFRLLWVNDYDEARAAIAGHGLIDVEVLPGMTVPRDLHVDIALRSSKPVIDVVAEYPETTRITPLPGRADRQLYRVTFSRLGENRLTLVQDGDRRTYLEFFSTEPVETMIAKRAAFIRSKQVRDPSVWWNGLLAEYANDTGKVLTPADYDRITGFERYMVTCDDPGLSKPAFLSSKNAEHPVAAEVEAMDYYIENFVWGKLQITGDEPLGDRWAYGVYGVPDWKYNRDSDDPGANGRTHIWRTYDYPHIFAMYFAMYRIARDHPAIPTRLDAATYLKRAFRTAIALFTIPVQIPPTNWSGYTIGFYNECVIPDIIEALRREGNAADADTLLGHWRKKVQYFTDPNVNLFGSEYPFDSTGFESTQALARSAIDNPALMGVSSENARRFADRQIAGNLFCRGWLEPAYYYLGSDYRGEAGDGYTLTYMSQMGGSGVLDYALNDATDPHPLLRLGYASQLSAWALLNSGSAADGYGYWYPGAANDGAASGGFEPSPFGTTWLKQPFRRGAWYYSSEIDLGFTGALRAARTIVADDPIFGRVAYGARLASDTGDIAVTPADGVRRRLSVRLASGRCDVVLENARFAAGRPVRLPADLSSVTFDAERFSATADIRARVRRGGGEWREVILPGTGSAQTIALA